LAGNSEAIVAVLISLIGMVFHPTDMQAGKSVKRD